MNKVIYATFLTLLSACATQGTGPSVSAQLSPTKGNRSFLTQNIQG